MAGRDPQAHRRRARTAPGGTDHRRSGQARAAGLRRGAGRALGRGPADLRRQARSARRRGAGHPVPAGTGRAGRGGCRAGALARPSLDRRSGADRPRRDLGRGRRPCARDARAAGRPRRAPARPAGGRGDPAQRSRGRGRGSGPRVLQSQAHKCADSAIHRREVRPSAAPQPGGAGHARRGRRRDRGGPARGPGRTSGPAEVAGSARLHRAGGPRDRDPLGRQPAPGA